MKMRSLVLCGCVLVLAATQANAARNTLKLKSPDGRIEMLLSVDAGHVSWQASMDGHAMLQKEPLDIHAAGDAIAGVIHFGKAQRYRIDDTYPWYGVHSMAEEHGRGLRVPFLGTSDATAFTLDARAYNNGVAFRMILPGSEPRVPQETVGFRPPVGSQVWSFDPSVAQYEGVYQELLAAQIPKGRFMAPPVVIELPAESAYLAITEGRLVNYPGMVLQSDGDGTFFARPGNEVPADKALIYFQGEETAKRLAIPAKISGPIVTPWRIVMIAGNLNSLVNNDIVSDVSDPPDLRTFPQGLHTPWIKPGRAVWNYLDGGATTLEGSEKMSQMAAELGFEYQEVEGYWRHWSEAQIKELVEYLAQARCWDMAMDKSPLDRDGRAAAGILRSLQSHRSGGRQNRLFRFRGERGDRSLSNIAAGDGSAPSVSQLPRIE